MRVKATDFQNFLNKGTRPLVLHNFAHMMKTIGIIPARYDSSRFPGKPLVDIHGKPMIQWVYEALLPSVDLALVATDNQEIYDVVTTFGGNAIYTSAEHSTGTNRVAEAYKNYCKQNNVTFDVILNIQGDEPMLDPKQVIELKNCFLDKETQVATLASKVLDSKELHNQSEVFLITDNLMNALYFSRHPIPFIKSMPKKKWLDCFEYKKHIGLYGFTPKAIEKFIQLEESSLEIAEGLEQNRWLQNGGKIKVGISNFITYPVDTPEDLVLIKEKMLK